MAGFKEKIAYLSDLEEQGVVPPGAVHGNLPVFGEDGKLEDSGKSPESFYDKQDTDQKISNAVAEAEQMVKDEYALSAYKSEPWSSATDYFEGDFCQHGGKGYRCVEDHTSGAGFAPTKWQLVLSSAGKLAIDNVLSPYSGTDKARLLDLCSAYNSSASYVVGQMVLKNGVLQVCHTAGRGAAAIFANGTVDEAIAARVAQHADNTQIHVTEGDKSRWDGKQNEISDIEQIRQGAAVAKALAGRDSVHVSSSTSVKAYKSSDIRTLYPQPREINVPYQHSTSANGFKLNLSSLCSEFLRMAETPGVTEKAAFNYIAVQVSGYTGSARLAVGKIGSDEPIQISNVATVISNQLTFEFDQFPWVDPNAEYWFKILNEGGTGYVSGLSIRYGAQHVNVDGFATNNNGGSYTSREGCFSGSAEINITYYGTVAELAVKSDIPTKTSDLQNDSGFITQDSVPTKVSQLTNDEGYLKEHQDISGKAEQSAVGAVYDTSEKEYAVGDTCTHDGLFYVCKRRVLQDAAWNPDDWQQTSLSEFAKNGGFQQQADWNESDNTKPSFIKNKPNIPSPVPVDSSLSHPGEAADAKATGDALGGKLESDSIDSEYSTSKSYAPGDTCIHDGVWYRCVYDVASGSEWDETKWSGIQLSDKLKDGSFQHQADWNESDNTKPSFIKNKPSIPSAVTIDPSLKNQNQAADAKAAGDAIAAKFNTSSVDSEYNTENSGYGVDDTCTHDGKWYKCVSVVAIGEEWSTDKWTEITVKQAIRDGVSQVQSDWDVDDPDNPAYIKNKPDIPDIDKSLSKENEAAEAKAVGDALARKLGSDKLPYKIVNLLPVGSTASTFRFNLVDHAVNVIQGNNGNVLEVASGKTVSLYPPSSPVSSDQDEVLGRDFFIVMYVSSESEEDIQVSFNGALRDYYGQTASIVACDSRRVTYRLTEISRSGDVFLVSMQSDPAWVAVKEIERALDVLLADGGLIDFTPGVFILDKRTGYYHEISAVSDPETGEVNVGTEQEGVIK